MGVGSFRGFSKRIPGARNTVYLGIVIRQMIGDQWRSPKSYDSIFATTPDPWKSESASERERFAITMGLLDRNAPRLFERAVEIGSAEGAFTRELQDRCESLLALDYSLIAVERTRANVGPSVEVRRWDMRKDPLNGRFDLVAAMGVLTSLYRPSDLRRVCSVIIRAIEPGGYLLFSDVRQSQVFETAWWGSLFLRGGEQILRYLARRSELQLIERAATDSHVFAIYLRRGNHS